ncbi:hypothetical protein E4U55_001239 [Claviceps digitariae]|nr:hypothetical protein E4U55_001239 [Claviceps digitariae]
MVMHDSHMGFDGQIGSSRHANDDMANIHIDFDTLLSAEHINSALNSFETCVHDDACLHFMQTQKPQEKLTHGYAQTPPETSSSILGPPQLQTRRGDVNRRKTLSPPISMDHSNNYSWDQIFTDSTMAGCNVAHAGGLGGCNDDDCASIMSCSSACDGSCPSQCGETSQAVCCDDDACRSPQVCNDEDCSAESRPCTDANCIVTPCATESQQPSLLSPVLSDGDKAAAVALASFGDMQSHAYQNVYMQQQQQQQQLLPPSAGASRLGNMDLMDLPGSLPCGSLSMESILTNLNGHPSFSSQPFQMAFEYALASHIMQYHDPAHGLAQHGSCVANDPSQLITKCTLPKYDPNDLANLDPFMPQLQTHECGFPIQDPNEFAHHIFQEHRPNMMVPGHQYGDFSGPSQSAAQSHHLGAHDDSWFNFNAAPNSKHFSPSTSPLTTMSMGPSSSETPLSIPTPSPLESEASLQDVSTASTATTMAQTISPAADRESPGIVQDDLYICRWVVGHGSSFICGQRFDSDEQLQKHCKHDHLKQLKKLNGGFRCGWASCSRDTCFTQRSKVERHMQVHTGCDKPLECEICGKRFSESSNLSKHRRTHNVKGMHECQLCGKDFHRLDQLRRHMGTNHKDRPAEVDAFLSQAKSKTKAHKVCRLKRAKIKARDVGMKSETCVKMDDDDDGDDGGGIDAI